MVPAPAPRGTPGVRGGGALALALGVLESRGLLRASPAASREEPRRSSEDDDEDDEGDLKDVLARSRASSPKSASEPRLGLLPKGRRAAAGESCTSISPEGDSGSRRVLCLTRMDSVLMGETCGLLTLASDRLRKSQEGVLSGRISTASVAPLSSRRGYRGTDSGMCTSSVRTTT